MAPTPERDDGDATGGSGGTYCCKVGRVASEFDVSGIVDRLAERRREGSSYRELATYFNTRIVERELSRAGLDDGRSVHAALVGDDIATDVYEVLHGDGDTDIRRAELRARLTEGGVDVSGLTSAFVSHVTVRSHLKVCASVEGPDPSPSFEQTVNTTQWARTRAANVVQSALDRAVRYDQLRTGPLDAEVLVRITCEGCGETFYLNELFEKRRCSCRDSADTDS